MASLRPIPITVEPQEVHVHADRRLSFQVLTAFGASAQESGASTKVLAEEKGRRLVEFHTPVRGLLGRRKVHRTVEWVALHEPERIDFEGVEGPLPLLRDRFTLEAQGNCTLFRYESTFGVRGWVLGWVLGVLYVRPMMKRFMSRHLEEFKETIEARAKRSRVYPQLPCSEEAEAQHAA